MQSRDATVQNDYYQSIIIFLELLELLEFLTQEIIGYLSHVPVEHKVQLRIIVCVFGVIRVFNSIEFLTQEIMDEDTSSIGWTEQIRKVRMTEVERDYESREILMEFITQ